MLNFALSQFIFCAAQLTLLSVLVLIVGRLLLNRRPDIASTVTAISILTGSCLFIVTVFGVPRLWLFQYPQLAPQRTSPTELATLPESEFQSNSVAIDRAANGHGQTEYSINSLGLQVTSWLHAPWLHAPVNQHQSCGPIFHFVSAVGIALLLRFLFGTIGLLHLRIRSSILKCSEVYSRVKSLAIQMQVRRCLQLRTCRSLNSPCVSWVSPRTIFVPVGFETWTADEQNATIAHELGHIKRGDAFWRVASQVAWTVNCWHPLMWLVRWQLTLAQELSSDRLAVIALGNKYRKGLSALALRLDVQASRSSRLIYYSGVSVSSSSLIRRIKMLNGFSGKPSMASRGQRVFAMGISLAVCLWLCCWSVEAQTTDAGQDENQATKTHTSLSKRQPFTGTVHKPWDKLNAADGYVSVNVSAMLDHPFLAKTLPVAWDALDFLKKPDGKRQSLTELGLPIENLSSIQTTINVHVRELAESERGESGHTRSASIRMGSGTLISTEHEVDWPALVGELDLTSIANAEVGEMFVKDLAATAVPGRELMISRFGLFDGSPSPKIVGSPQSLKRKIHSAMWNRVSGGIGALLIDMSSHPELNKRDYEPEIEWERELLVASQLIQGIAVGVDVSDSPKLEHMRLALEPVSETTADQLAKLVEQLLPKMADEYEKSKPDENLQGLRQAVVEVQSGDEGSFVLVTGKLPLLQMLRGLDQGIVQ